uniref:AlNc14C130G6944 protein n=1 Tax=Albugo laibachii Nc14 TaxID=890382 RepID=F0WK92_9STRA|nr:AlNc14C130G6944 [Albugo laibachii Nc14]|eukprot:CCA21695.1 AlNc14C130G6944 [Albugo laibachii Nc14]
MGGDFCGNIQVYYKAMKRLLGAVTVCGVIALAEIIASLKNNWIQSATIPTVKTNSIIASTRLTSLDHKRVAILQITVLST